MKTDFSVRLRKFTAALEQIDTEKLILESARETEQLALDLNRLQLLADGVDGDGRSLGKYSESTKKRKQAKGQETGHITLYDKGNFQDRMFLNVKNLPIFIDSRDEKTGKLKNRFGPAILKLTKENQEEYKEEVMGHFKNKLNNHIENLKAKILL